MADPSVTYPHGLVEDFLVKVENFVFSDNFVVLDMKEDDTCRLFWKTFPKYLSYLGRHQRLQNPSFLDLMKMK